MSTIAANENQAMKMAKLVSDIFHPWVILVPVMALAAYQATGGAPAWIAWTLLAYVPALAFPLLYAKVLAMRQSNHSSQQKISRSLVRNNSGHLFVSTALFGIPSALLLYYLNAPRSLLIIILGVTAAMLVTALVNIWYHSSLHLAMVTSMLTAMVFLFSNVYLLSFILLPILGFSRYQLGEHTPLQTVTGFCIGLAVGGAIFYSLGLAA